MRPEVRGAAGPGTQAAPTRAVCRRVCAPMHVRSRPTSLQGVPCHRACATRSSEVCTLP